MRQAASMVDGKKRRYITYRVDAYLRDKFGPSSGKRRPLHERFETCWRFVNFCKFCVVCSVSLLHVLAPWVLSIIEVTAVVLTYLLGTSRPMMVSSEAFHFNYMHSVEDVVAICMGRAIILSGVYTWGMQRVPTAGALAHRPYLYTSYLLAAICFPYVLVKIILYRYSTDPIAAAAIFIVTGIFTWFHVFAARRTVEYARRSYAMSLAGSSAALSAAGMGNWAEGAGGGADAWTGSMRRPETVEMSKTSESGPSTEGPGAGVGTGAGSEDVPAESLADDDSRFIDILGVKVHYKEFAPACLSYPAGVSADGLQQQGSLGSMHACSGPASSGVSLSNRGISRGCSEAGNAGTSALGIGAGEVGPGGAPACMHACGGATGPAGPAGMAGTAIVLMHGYGGGVFAWRHVMEALALQCQCRVVAFDRPAFGLTSRPPVSSEQRCGPSNPYALDFQVELLMQLCAQLGLRRVLLVAHADACLLALRAACIASKTSECASVVPAAAPSHITLSLPPGAGGTQPATATSGSGAGSSHAFSVLYSGSSAFVRPCDRGVDVQPVASSTSTSAAVLAAGTGSTLGGLPLAGAAHGSTSGAAGRTVLRMRAQAAPSSHIARDTSPPAPLSLMGAGGSHSHSVRSPCSPHSSTPAAASAAGTAAGSMGHAALVGLPPLPPPLFVGPSEDGGLQSPPSATPSAHFASRPSATSLPGCGTSVGMATPTAIGSPGPWSSAVSPNSVGDAPWSPCEVPAPGYALSAAAAASASAEESSWDDMADGSSVDGSETAVQQGTSGHTSAAGEVCSSASQSLDVHQYPGGGALYARHCGSTPYPAYRTADADLEAGPGLPPLPSHSSVGSGLCPRPLGSSVAAVAPLSTVVLVQGQLGPRHRRTLSTGSGPAGSSGAQALCQQQAGQGQQGPGAVSMGGCLSPRQVSGQALGCAAGGGSCGGAMRPHAHAQPLLPWPTLLGMALLHPDLEPRGGSTLSRMLASSGLGGSLIRPLLRSELGDVANRRSWYNAERLTPEVLELYRTPFRVQGWDAALIETVRLTREQSVGDVAEGLAAAAASPSRPVLVLTAAHDTVATPAKAEKVCASVPHAQMTVLPDCGHLSHEELPGLLLQQLVPFCGQVLLPAQHNAGQAARA